MGSYSIQHRSWADRPFRHLKSKDFHWRWGEAHDVVVSVALLASAFQESSTFFLERGDDHIARLKWGLGLCFCLLFFLRSHVCRCIIVFGVSRVRLR